MHSPGCICFSPCTLRMFSVRRSTQSLLVVFPIGRRSDVLCEQPPSIGNGVHNGTGGTTFPLGSVVVYSCNDGFNLVGDRAIQCLAKTQDRGVWSTPTPECRGDHLLGPSCCLLSVFKTKQKTPPYFYFLFEPSKQTAQLRTHHLRFLQRPQLESHANSVALGCITAWQADGAGQC